MAMTLEQKVAKKAKSFNSENLKFKKGLAIVIRGLDEEAAEYSSNCDYQVQMHFKSKAAINRVGVELGKMRFDKKRMLANYERGIKSTNLHLSSNDLFTLEAGLNIYRTINFYYKNGHTGQHYSLEIDPTQPLAKEYENKYTGSTADGEPLSKYYNGIQEQIVKGGYTYLR